MKKGKFVLLIALALIITRLPLLYQPFLDVDEALFAIFARVWQHGGVPYVNAVETKAMGIYYFYVFASWLAGSLPNINMVAVHALTIIWTGLTAWVIARITARLSNERAGLWAALLFVLFSSFYFPKIVATSQNAVLLLPLCLVVDLLMRPAPEVKSWMSFVAGMMVAAATLVKYQAGIMIFVVLMYFWIFLFSKRRALSQSFWFCLGGLPLPALMLFQLHLMGALPDFWYWNFGGSLRYIQSGSAAVDLWRKFKSHVLTYVASTALIWVLAGLRFKTWWRQGWAGWLCSPREAFVWLWFFFGIIPVCLGKRFYGHYFLILLPQLCILSALQIASWDAAAWQHRRKWVIGFIIFPFVLSIVPRYWQRPFYALISEEVVTDYRPYGDYIKARTRPEDRIVVWGYSPAVYWYSERLPATRFLWSDVLVGRMPGVQRALEPTIDFKKFERPEIWEMFFSDLARNPPACIIDMAPTGLHNYQHFVMSKYPQVMAYVATHYEAEPDLLGAKVFRRKGLVSNPSSTP